MKLKERARRKADKVVAKLSAQTTRREMKEIIADAIEEVALADEYDKKNLAKPIAKVCLEAFSLDCTVCGAKLKTGQKYVWSKGDAWPKPPYLKCTECGQEHWCPTTDIALMYQRGICPAEKKAEG